MKKIVLITLSFVLLMSCAKKESTKTKEQLQWIKDSTEFAKRRDYIVKPENGTVLQWIDSTYLEFDSIKEGKSLNLSWRFKNMGTKPLVIANVTTGCGCTIVERPQNEVLPGNEGVIKATFNSKGMQGWVRKEIDVLCNNKSSSIQVLSFAAHVMK